MVDYLKCKTIGAKAVPFGLLLCLAFLTGCGSVATQKGFYDPITADLRKGDYQAAVAGIEAARDKNKYTKKDRFVYYVDAGLAYHYSSMFDSSNARLHKAEDAAEELFTRSISRAAMSLLLNDNVLEYTGEDFEIVYTNLIKALNYIVLDDFDGAFVEIKRVNEKLNLLEQKYRKAVDDLNRGNQEDSNKVNIKYKAEKVRFNNDAFARYLSMHIYAADGKMDDARIDRDWLERAFAEQPHIYPFDMPDVKYYSKEKSILSVIGMAGLSPVKEALNLRIRTDKDLDLVQVLYTDPERQNSEYGHFPLPIDDDYYFKLAIPELVDRASLISDIIVLVDSVPVGRLHMIEDVGAVARETFKAKKSLIYIRTVARAIVKGLLAHKQKKKADTGGLGGWLKKAAIDVATDISENADLRCARLLPGRIFVGDFEIEPGPHDIVIEFHDQAGHPIESKFIENYTVLKRGLNMVEAFSVK
jgi:hypothetical protein